ncbi:MAG: AAA family ATPase [Saprospiraceae bacterium]|nr:AAA family ATPase [Saprospiraceae bacterium]
MEKKILPIGRQSFRRLREDNCIYVDQTKHVYGLCRDGGAYFLSRPHSPPFVRAKRARAK